MSVSTHVRDGDAGDIAAVMEVMSAAFDPIHGEAWSAPQCLSALTIPGTALMIAEAAGRPTGFALFRTLLDEAELLLIACSPRHRRRGIGSLLLEAVLQRVAEAGGNKLHLEMRANNPALDFYLCRGFTNVGRRRDYYRGLDGCFTDALTMQRDLAVELTGSAA